MCTTRKRLFIFSSAIRVEWNALAKPKKINRRTNMDYPKHQIRLPHHLRLISHISCATCDRIDRCEGFSFCRCMIGWNKR